MEAYLQEIVENQTKILERLASLEKKVIGLGHGCRRAFDQTKEVVNRLGEFQQHLGESLDEYGGVIEASTFDWT